MKRAVLMVMAALTLAACQRSETTQLTYDPKYDGVSKNSLSGSVNTSILEPQGRPSSTPSSTGRGAGRGASTNSAVEASTRPAAPANPG